MGFDLAEIDFIAADGSWVDKITEGWGEKAGRHLHISDGFTLIACHQGQPIGFISAYWRTLPEPLNYAREAYIDILDVLPAYRRIGVARRLIEMTLARARQSEVYQVRSWSSVDKIEALPMWRRVGFGLAPATTYPGGQEIKGFFVTFVL